MKERKILFILLMTIIGITITGLGATYAWFNYYQESDLNNVLVAGDIYLNMTSGSDTISLTNVFPETVSEARKR